MPTNWKHETAKSPSNSQSFNNPANRNETRLLLVIFKMPHTLRHTKKNTLKCICMCICNRRHTRVCREVDSCRLGNIFRNISVCFSLPLSRFITPKSMQHPKRISSGIHSRMCMYVYLYKGSWSLLACGTLKGQLTCWAHLPTFRLIIFQKEKGTALECEKTFHIFRSKWYYCIYGCVCLLGLF